MEIKASSINKAHIDIIKYIVNHNYLYCDETGYWCHMSTEPIMVILNHPLNEKRISIIAPFSKEYLDTYSVDVITPFNCHGFEYTYGERIYPGIRKLIDNLTDENKLSRRNITHTWKFEDYDSEHPPCMQTYQFMIKPDNTVDTFITFRSHDMFKGWSANMYAFTELHKIIVTYINDKLHTNIYKVGRCTIVSNNPHIYATDMEDCKNAIKRL